MKISVTHDSEKIGVDGTITKLLTEKKVYIRLTIEDDDNKQRLEFVINHKEASHLFDRLNECLNDPRLKEYGFVLA